MEGLRLGRYRIDRRLAAGGMAEVFAATVEGAAGFQKPVAVKRILPHLCEDPDFVEMFREEARLASRLSHANIAQVFDFDVIDGQHLLAMEWVHGKDLRRALRAAKEADRPPSPARAAFIAREVARALHHAHTAPGTDGRPLSLVHRDVSPQNILLSFAGEVKLTDFGIAKAATGAVATAAGVIKGKSGYMSPEQARGEGLDARSDVFALAVVLWESLTGRRLFTGDSDVEILRAVQTFPAAAPSAIRAEVPRDLDEIVLRALAKDPDDRHESALVLEGELTDVILAHAAGARDLDLSAWLSEIFASEAAEHREAPPEADKRTIGRGGTALALAAPPPPEDPRDGDALHSLAPEVDTSDLPGAPPRGAGIRRAAGVLSLGAGAAGALVAAVVLSTGSPGEQSIDDLVGRAERAEQDAGAPGERPPQAEELDGELAADAGRLPSDEEAPAFSTTGAAERRRPAKTQASADPRQGRRGASRGAASASPGVATPKGPAGSAAERSEPASLESGHVSLDSGAAGPSATAPAAPTTVLSQPDRGRSSSAPDRPSADLVGAGTRLFARLSLGVETSDAAVAEARLVRSHVSGGRVLLPRETRLTGRATASGDRVTIRFDRLVLPSGASLPLDAAAYAEDGRLGIAAMDVLTAGGETERGERVLTLAPGTNLMVVLASDVVLERP